MAEVHRRAVHERATPDNPLDSASLALANRRLADTPLAEGPVKPDPGNSALAALPDQLDRDRRVSGDDDPVDSPRNGGEVRVTPGAFDLGCLGIDRECLVAGVAQFAVNGVGGLSRFSLHARYGDALPAEKCGHGLGNVDH